MPNQSIAQAVAVALKLDKSQVEAICRYGDVHLMNKTQGIREVKAVELTIPQAGEIWGFLNSGRALYQHRDNGNLVVTNTGGQTTRVTVAAILAMEEILEKSPRGRKRR